MAKTQAEPSETLLKTKLHIPRTRSVLVQRPRLLDLINRHDPPCFTLISAPAGFGKTTLLSDWVDEIKIPAAWVSLDSSDNDPVRFLSYVSAALMSVDPTVGDDALAAIQSPQAVSIERILALVINDIAEYESQVALILDDYQFIEAAEVHEALFNVVEQLPANLHLLISSRIDPPWPFARFRARGMMNEIRADELRFTEQETSAFLNEMMDLALSADQIAQLGDRTEGWIAGLQMVALTLQDRVDRTQFIEAFSGSHRYILDYLMEEVLERQPQEMREFLLETSILERLCAPLCERLTGQSNGQEIIERIDQSNLFLVALDDDRRWYRYHQLFADLLRSRLREIHPDRLLELHQHASQWYEEHNLIYEAIYHGFEAEDAQRSIELIQSNSLELVFQGGLKTLERWLEMLPTDSVERNPRLCLAKAWVCAYTGQADGCHKALEACEKALEDSEGDLPDRDLIVGQLLGIRAYTLLEDAISLSTQANAFHIAIDALWELSVLTFYRGKLGRTMEICHQALDLANQSIREGGRRLPIVGYVYTRMALVLWARGELDRALELAIEGARLSDRWGFSDVLFMSNVTLARIRSDRREYDLALQAITRAMGIASELSPHYLQTAQALEALIHLHNDNLIGAREWSQDAPVDVSDEPDFRNLQDLRILCHIEVIHARKKRQAIPETLIVLLERLIQICDEIGAHGQALDPLITLFLAYNHMDQKELAKTVLEKALHHSHSEGYIQPFLQSRPELLPTLRQLHREQKYRAFIDRILVAGELTAKSSVSKKAALLLAEDLSERELDVLRYLPSQLSTNEIAQELYVATSTVRSHIKSIYGKLAVHSRREAVERARELELL